MLNLKCKLKQGVCFYQISQTLEKCYMCPNLKSKDDLQLVNDSKLKDDKALRFNDGKLKWSYVHFKSLEPMVRVLMFGAHKYAPFNWQKPMDKKEILESMMRHLTALMDGEEKDPESGIDHMGHIMCNALFYNYHNGYK